MAKITILLVEDHEIVRAGIRKILEMQDDFEIVGEATNGRRSVELVKTLKPDVVLMDIAMPLMNGVQATRQLLKAMPSTKVLMLSAHGEHGHIRNALEAGAMGFLLKQTSANEVCRAIRTVQSGKTFHSASLARRIASVAGQSLNSMGKMVRKKENLLTPREMEVLQLIAEGRANKETAAELGIGAKTVEKHREHLMQKLDIHDTAGLTRYAISSGIIEGSAPSQLH